MVLTARGGGGGIGAMRIRILRVRRGEVVEMVVALVALEVAEVVSGSPSSGRGGCRRLMLLLESMVAICERECIISSRRDTWCVLATRRASLTWARCVGSISPGSLPSEKSNKRALSMRAVCTGSSMPSRLRVWVNVMTAFCRTSLSMIAFRES